MNVTNTVCIYDTYGHTEINKFNLKTKFITAQTILLTINRNLFQLTTANIKTGPILTQTNVG